MRFAAHTADAGPIYCPVNLLCWSAGADSMFCESILSCGTKAEMAHLLRCLVLRLVGARQK